MKVIGLTGGEGVGKDTVAGMILDEASGHVRSFSKPLEDAVLAVFCDGDLIEAAKALFALSEHQLRDLKGMSEDVPYWDASGGQLIDRLGCCLVAEFGGQLWWCVNDDNWPNFTPGMFGDRAQRGQLLPDWGLSPAEVVANFKAAVFREFGDDVLLKRADLELCTLQLAEVEQARCNVVVVFTDVMTDVQAEWLKARGGLVVEVIRPIKGADVSVPGVKHHLIQERLYNESDLGNLKYHTGYNLKGWMAQAEMSSSSLERE